VAAIAERFEDRLAEGRTELGLAPAALGLPPGSLPVDAVRGAIRGYQAGVITGDRLIAIVDRHGEALEREIARKAAQHLAEFQRMIDRADVLAGYISLRLAQLEWLKRFPTGPDQEAVPLRCPVGGGRAAEIPGMLAAMREVELPLRAVKLDPHLQRLDGRRGAALSMAALADAGVSVTDVALELGCGRRKAWSLLNGRQRRPPELQPCLERLLGVDQAAVVLEGIPHLPRARAPTSAAVEVLHAAGATAGDVAELVPARPSTVSRWLRGTLRPSPKAAAALAGALERLLGEATAVRVLELIPSRNGRRGG